MLKLFLSRTSFGQWVHKVQIVLSTFWTFEIPQPYLFYYLLDWWWGWLLSKGKSKSFKFEHSNASLGIPMHGSDKFKLNPQSEHFDESNLRLHNCFSKMNANILCKSTPYPTAIQKIAFPISYLTKYCFQIYHKVPILAKPWTLRRIIFWHIIQIVFFSTCILQIVIFLYLHYIFAIYLKAVCLCTY